jgi:hypothetical protein
MKNDIKIILFSISVIASILFSTFYINNYIVKTTDYLISEIKIIESNLDQNQWQNANDRVNKLVDSWEKIEKKWTLIINHHEIDSITISLKSVDEYIETRNRTDAQTYISILKHYIGHIPKMEELSWENIF